MDAKKPMGRPRTKGDRPTYPLRVRQQLLDELRMYAQLKDRPLSDILDEAIESWWTAKHSTNAKAARQMAQLRAANREKGKKAEKAG